MTGRTLGVVVTRRVDAPVVRAWWARHPELPLAAVIAATWAWLSIDHVAHHGEPQVGWHFSLGTWTAMVVAMMVPAILPMQRWVAFNSLWCRRHRASVLFASTYVAVWVGFGAALAAIAWAIGALTEWEFAPGRFAAAATFAAASLWQLTPVRRRALRRCHLRRPLAPRGRRADASVVRYGWFVARACIVSCGGVMVAMFVAAHDVHLMLPLTAIILVERFQFRPDERLASAGIALVAALSLLG